MQLTKRYLMLLGLISLMVLQGASTKLRSQSQPHSFIANVPDSLTGTESLLFDVGDVDGDGVDDFIVRLRKPLSSCKDGDNYLMISTGKGNFKRENLDCSLDFQGTRTTLTFGDFNGDGRQDILRTDDGESSAEILFYVASGQFLRFSLPSSYKLDSESTTATIGDFNNDGKDDFIRQESGASAQVFLSTCALNGVDFEKTTISGTDACINIVVGDYDGDKDDDFICQEKNENGSGFTGILFLSNGDGEFTKKDLPDGCTTGYGKLPQIHTGDFNQDRKTDFIFQTTCPAQPKPTSSSAWYWTDWTTFTAAQPLPGRIGSGAGTIATNTGTVQVTYSGDAHNAATSGQFKGFVNAPTGTYVNGPTNGDGLYFNLAQRTETFTFSRPVVNPRIAVWSLGSVAIPVTLDFAPNQVTLLSSGQNKEYPNPNSRLVVSGTKVTGYEGNGIFEVQGTFTELTFQKLNPENWYIMNVAISDVDPASCPASSLYLATGDGDFSNVALPAAWNLDGQNANIYVGDFNFDGKSDFLRQDTVAEDDSDVEVITVYFEDKSDSLRQDRITVYGSSLTPTKVTTPPFYETEVSGTTSKDSHLSTLYLGNFNGNKGTDYIQYWSDSSDYSYEIVTARYVGSCLGC